MNPVIRHRLRLLSLLFGVTMSCQTKSAPHTARETVPLRLLAPAVAGVFYPSEPGALRHLVDDLLAQAKQQNLVGLRALISPHAGYRYSGPVAASGYRQLKGLQFERVVILAPSHRVAFRGVAIPDADAIDMPLGNVRLSPVARTLAESGPFVIDSAPHAQEHSLEVQLPFLQATLNQFELVPLVFGDVVPKEVATRVDTLVDNRTLLVASSDLSHFYGYEKAKELDAGTINAILKLDLRAMEQREACGKGPILALLEIARSRGWKATLLDARNSGDTASDRSRVVGYAAIAFTEMPE